MRLDTFSSAEFDRGVSLAIEVVWVILSGLLIASWLPGSGWRVQLLRVFGANIGDRVVVKPGVRVKFPWRLSIGNNSWIGEDVWIDNLVNVSIGENSCISQGAYICTGSHDWTSSTFDLIVQPITIQDHAWVAAKSSVGPGVTVGEGAILSIGSTATKNLEPWSIHHGSPATFVRKRVLVPVD